MEVGHTKRQPVYAHLLHYSINLLDGLWANVSRYFQSDTTFSVVVPGSDAPVDVHCSSAEKEALTMASLDIVEKLMAG